MATKRAIKDALFVKAKALPAANANNNTATFDLGAGGYAPEEIEVEIAIPALASLADDKLVTIKVQDSADDSSYATVDPLIQTTVVGAGGVGASAKTIRLRLPANVRRYVQFNQAVDNGGGTLTASSVTYSLLF
jgi:hypothetical protein